LNNQASHKTGALLRKALLYFLIGSFLLGAGFAGFFTMEVKEELLLHEAEQRHMTDIGQQELLHDLEAAVTELVLLASHHELRPFLEDGNLDHLDQLAKDFISFAEVTGKFDQIRLIDLRGMEILRIDYDEFMATSTDSQELQDKSQRYYFPEIMRMQEGAFYISPLDLNVERGKIGEPSNPTLRMGTPLFNQAGERRGILLLNYKGRNILEALNEHLFHGGEQVLLTKSNQFWLQRLAEGEWHFVYAPEKRLALEARSRKYWAPVFEGGSGQFYSEEGLVSFHRISLGLSLESVSGNRSASQAGQSLAGSQGQTWQLLTIVPKELLYAKSSAMLKRLILIYLLLILGIAAGSFAYAKLKLSEKEAEEDQRLSSSVFESASEAIMVSDAEKKILSINSAFTQITGYGREEVLGKSTDILCSDKHNSFFYKEIWDFVEKNGQWQGELWSRRKNGKAYPEWRSISSVKDECGQIVQYTSLFSDITERKENEAKLHYQAYHDPLTTLPNRILFVERLLHSIKLARRNERKVALLFLDLDHFKQVNDTFGHPKGDEILKQVANRLVECVRETDTVARSGGDEFMVVLSNISGKSEAGNIAGKMLEKLKTPFYLDGQEVFLGLSIGISLAPDDSDDVTILLKQADMAMYQSKKKGRNTASFFSEKMEKKAKERTLLEWDLRRALSGHEFLLHYQPVVDLATLKTVSFEALIRWQHPKRGLVLPEDFIPLAEKSELISQIGAWVLMKACKQMKEWQMRYGLDASIAVNVSSRTFKSSNLWAALSRALEESGLNPDALTLEITERLMLDTNEASMKKLKTIKDVGIHLSVDDFGTGYSSLTQLSRYPSDVLKIDKSFISGLASDPRKKPVVEAIIRMGQSMGMKIVAEGIETYEELLLLRELGCDEAQGYYFSKPLSATDYTEVLAAKEVV